MARAILLFNALILDVFICLTLVSVHVYSIRTIFSFSCEAVLFSIPSISIGGVVSLHSSFLGERELLGDKVDSFVDFGTLICSIFMGQYIFKFGGSL